MDFRPPPSRRLALIACWPGGFSGLALPAAAGVVFGRSAVLSILGVLLLLAYGLGLYRGWRVRVTITNDEVIVVNPLRTRRLRGTQEVSFGLDVIFATFPAAVGVAVSLDGRQIPIVASGYFTEADRALLSVALRSWAAATGGVCEVPLNWKSMW